LSRGRNAGWRVAKGELVLFPDDDCWYPPFLLSRALQILKSLAADVVTGRASDKTGRDINGRYSKVRQRINRSNVWVSGIEWVMIFKKSTLIELNGFDEHVGLGADTPWQACEGQEIIIRALAGGKTCFFDPDLFGYHEELDVMSPSNLMVSKGRAYGRGLGYVLRAHKYHALNAIMWMSRPIFSLLLNVVKGNFKPCTYLLNVSIGRLEGYMGRTWKQKI
jgi:glycosyltransferase involved in cell wall biosynthesis